MRADTKPYVDYCEDFVSMISPGRECEFLVPAPGIEMLAYIKKTALIEMRIGPSITKSEIEKEYAKQSILERGKKDIGHLILKHLAAGKTKTCFDETAFFANSHTFGTGDNLLKENFRGQGQAGGSHRVIALITNTGFIRPVIYHGTSFRPQERTYDDEIMVWADCKFGLAYGFWWDAINVDVSGTPTVDECRQTVENVMNQFLRFTVPNESVSNGQWHVHERWEPSPDNFKLLCNLEITEKLHSAVSNGQRCVAKIIPTSVL